MSGVTRPRLTPLLATWIALTAASNASAFPTFIATPEGHWFDGRSWSGGAVPTPPTHHDRQRGTAIASSGSRVSGFADGQSAFWGIETTGDESPIEVFRLHVVPEPATALLLSLGLIALRTARSQR